jgi:pimeloyl-ACP methyl ester carboxylesterase
MAGLLGVGLVAACASSGSPAERATPSTSVVVSEPPAVGRLLAGQPMVACTIERGPSNTTAPALCGTLDVPEDRSEPSGRQISLRVAVVPATTDEPEPDAFFVLAGGPGDAGTDFFGWLPGLFEDVNATRDIVIVDQRVTGASNALVLPPLPDTSGLSEAEAEARLHSWADGWLASIDADPRQYTSTVAADDIEAVREALGYEQVDLYGPSYGGTLAQYYLRQHPDRVRLAIMDGATPLDVPVFEHMAASSQAALDLVIERCQADAACQAAYPDLPAEWARLLAALSDGVDTGITDPDTGEPLVATLEMLGPGLHQALLDPGSAGQLPLGIHLAAQGRWAEVAEAFPEASGGGGGDWLAMSEIIQCSEGWARFDVAEVDRLGKGSYALPMELADAEARAARCRALPSGDVPADDAAPVLTDLPILWLTADGDPQDPPANLASVPSQQPNARIVAMPAHRHTIGHTGCAPTVIGDFVETASTDGLDTSCIEQADVPPLTFTLP